jgi:hypothetical protein
VAVVVDGAGLLRGSIMVVDGCVRGPALEQAPSRSRDTARGRIPRIDLIMHA